MRWLSQPACEPGLEQSTPTFDKAPARGDQRYDEHRRHDSTNEKAQLGACACSVCDEPHDDPGESCVEHRDERGGLAYQVVGPAPRGWAVRLVQTLLVIVVPCREIRLEAWRDLEIAVTEAIHAGQEPEVVDPGFDEADVRRHPDEESDRKDEERNAVKPSPNLVARATSANATTVADTTVRKMAARLKTAR